MTGHCRIGVDVGGTFTDFVLTNPETGVHVHHKEPSAPAEPAAAVAQGMAALLARAGAEPRDVALVVHGTTLALNAVIQRRGAPVALVVNEGFGDILQLGRGGLPNAYNYKHPKLPPLISRDLIFEVAARTQADGTVTTRPREAELDALAERLGAAGVDAVAVVLLNAYAYPELEEELAAALAARLADVLITRSSALWPEIREFERALVTTLNAFIHPAMNGYYGALADALTGIGVAAPVTITTSNGGMVGVETARARPVDTLLSGPASGVVAAAQVAELTGHRRVITLDMGGTSSDIAISTDGRPEHATQTKVGDFPLMLPVVNVWAIGAGGGSVVWVDAQGVLKVGPHSAGADPGPVCYGRGGSEPTVTDCYIVAGLLDPAHFLGGRMTLDKAAAEKALASLAARIGIEGEDAAVRAADAALRVATAAMATEVSKGMAQRGLDPADFALMPYGGAGPTHANLLADEAGLRAIVVPPAPGTFCALGAVMTDVRRDFARSQRVTLGVDAGAMADLRDVIANMEQEARDWIAGEVGLAGAAEIRVAADMQYPRTAFELTTAIPDATWRDGEAADVAELFHAEHERLYGFRDAESPVDITTLRLTVRAAMPSLALPKAPGGEAPRPLGQRRVFLGGAWREAAVYRRSDLPAGAELAGPAVCEQEDSTVWILPGWHAAVDAHGVLLLKPE